LSFWLKAALLVCRDDLQQLLRVQRDYLALGFLPNNEKDFGGIFFFVKTKAQEGSIARLLLLPFCQEEEVGNIRGGPLTRPKSREGTCSLSLQPASRVEIRAEGLVAYK